MYIDWYYIVLVLPAVLFSMWASAHVNSTFKRYAQVPAARGMTGADAARAVLSSGGVSNINIVPIAGQLTDHYDPSKNQIALSENVMNTASVAAVGVAAHEAGHALQHATGYGPMKIRSAIIPITNIGSKISMPLIIIGLMLCYFGMRAQWIAYAGVIAYGICLLFQLVTLPTEFNASGRAIKALSATGTLSQEELKGARKVLNAAALTYVASLAVTLMTILRFVLLINNTRRRN